MKELLINLRLSAATATEHLADDPALLMLQISRRLPARVVQPAARLLLQWSKHDSWVVPVLLAGLMHGEHEDVARRLNAALESDGLAAETRRSLADVALVLNRPDLADAFLTGAEGAKRFRAAQARRLWYDGAMTASIAALAGTSLRSESLQARRLAAELRILQGWRPQLATAPMVPQPRRVLHVLTNSLPHTASGYAQRSHSILLAQREAGWDAMAVTRVGYPVQVGKLAARHHDVVDGVMYRRLLPPRLAATLDGRLQQQAEALLAVVLEFRPSVLHTTTHHVNALVTEAVAAAVGIPWVYEVRGQLADTWAASRGPEALDSERYRLFREREADAMHAADLVVTLGEAMRMNVMGAGIPANKVLLAPNAVGGEFLSEPVDQAEACRLLGLDSGARYIGTVSSIVDYEGLDNLLSAFALLAPVYPQLKLLIVGDGVALPALREQARAVGLQGRVTFTGRVPRSQAHLYHQAMEIFAVPRKDLAVTRDVTPLKPVEAMAAARPVVASDLPALGEIVTDGITGLLVGAEDPADFASALDRLLRSEDLRAAQGAAGRKAVLQTRTWAANATAMSSAYMKLTENMH